MNSAPIRCAKSPLCSSGEAARHIGTIGPTSTTGRPLTAGYYQFCTTSTRVNPLQRFDQIYHAKERRSAASTIRFARPSIRTGTALLAR